MCAWQQLKQSVLDHVCSSSSATEDDQRALPECENQVCFRADSEVSWPPIAVASVANDPERKSRLAERIVSLQDVERKEIAQELHDEFEPYLFALRAHATSLTRMDARSLSILSISLLFVAGRAHAQNAPSPNQASGGTLPSIEVFATTPLAGAGIDIDKVPASVTTIDSYEIQSTHSLNIADALQRWVPGIIVNEVAGNPFQPDVQFRGFVASPVAGTPQGLAVYQNGVRINEAFGDTVNWDLIPTAAIRSVGVVTNNPAFGLNALGGAVNIQMKDGFTYQGAEINTMGGSFGRIQSSAQWGKQVEKFAVYGALEGLHDDGFRNFSASNVRRFYGDIGYKNDTSEFHLNMGAAYNNFGAAATVPIELLQQYYGAVYTTPQPSTNRVGYLNLTGKVEVTPTWTVEGSAHLRAFNHSTQDGNPTGAQPCTANPALLCFGDGTTPANGLNGAQLANPFAPGTVLGEIDRTTTRSTTTGLTVQATNTDQLFGHNNRVVVGGSLDYGVTNFSASAELGTISPNFVVRGSGIFLGSSGSPVSIGPVGLHTTNQYTGLYALNTFDVTKDFAITGGRAVQCRQHKAGGPDRQCAERQRHLQPVQSDHRGHLQNHSRHHGLCRLFGSQSGTNPARTRLRRSGTSLHHRHVPRLRSSAETDCVPHRRGWFARHARLRRGYRHARMEAWRFPHRQY